MRKQRKRNEPINIGDKFGMLTVIKELEPSSNDIRQYRMVLCLCDCGSETRIRLASITSGQTTSCGCLRVEFAKHLTKKQHGLCGHPIYNSWESMIQRCYNKNCFGYKYYGGRGISVCDEWRNDFKVFYDWSISNGWKPGLQIDRYPNNDGNYEPSNCRWATRLQNINNRRNTRQLV